MVKVYYGNGYKEAMFGSPIYTNNASQIYQIQKTYSCVSVEDINYEDVQEGMNDEQRLAWYLEETGERLEKVDDRFWDFAEDYFSIH